MTRKIKLNAINEQLMLASNKELVQKRLDELNAKREKVTDDQRIAALKESTKSREKAVAFAAAREERINSYLWCDNFAMLFYELVTLRHNEWPEIVNTHDQPFNILVTNVHGEAPVQNWARENSVTKLDPYLLSSGIVKYPILTALTGRIDVSGQADEDASRSMDIKINTDLYTQIDAAYGNYPAGTKTEESRFVTGTLPSSNDIDASAQGSFTFEVYRQLCDHFIRLGRNLRFILMNPTEMKDTWDWQSLVSTAASGSQDGRTMVTTQIREEILRSGQPSGTILGQNVQWVLDPTRALKYAVAFSDRPAGTLYAKEELDEVNYYDKKWMKGAGFGNNFEGIEYEKWIVPTIKDVQRLEFVRIQFVT